MARICARHSLSLAAFERLDNRVQVELRSNRAPSELHEPDNFITFVSSPRLAESVKRSGVGTSDIIADRSVGIGSAHLLLQRRPGRLDPRLLDALHLGRSAEGYFYAMEFVEGKTLENPIKRSGRLEVKLALDGTSIYR